MSLKARGDKTVHRSAFSFSWYNAMSPLAPGGYTHDFNTAAYFISHNRKAVFRISPSIFDQPLLQAKVSRELPFPHDLG
jgi:hypothetical protein